MQDAAPSFYLVVDTDLSAVGERAREFAAASVACVLIRETAVEATPAAALRGSLEALQAQGIAVLCETVARARELAADGMHINLCGGEDMGQLKAAIAALKPGGIVGVGGLHSRHTAMSAGELDIDYVMFGEPDRNGQGPAVPALLERAEWWAQTFTIPCVVHATEPPLANAIAETGCEFISLGFFPDIRLPQLEPLERGS